VSSFAPKVSSPAASTNKAETFTESDLSIGHGLTVVSGESLVMPGGTPSTADRPADNDSTTNSGLRGLVVTPNEPLGGIEATLSSNYGGEGTVAELIRMSDGAVLDSVDATGLSPGDTVTLLGPLESGTDYGVQIGDPSNDTLHGRYGSTSYPYTSDEVDITDGLRDGTNRSGNAYNFTDVTSYYTNSTSATVEWSFPADVYGWDTVLFQNSPGDGTVDIFIEENQSGSWTEIAGPVSRGDVIPADPANNVRYRIDFSRPGSDTEPTVDALYRRRKL